MPTKLSDADSTPNNVEERLHAWGGAIRAGRFRYRFTAAGLCEPIRISEATLRRIERGDTAVAAGTYLSALAALGLLNTAVPRLPPSLGEAKGQRVRHNKVELEDDDGRHF